MARVCIVTPDIIGPIINGGIGTACYNLAMTLTAAGDHVSILFTGPCQNGTIDNWELYYERLSIEFIDLFSTQRLDYPVLDSWYISNSLRVYEYLKRAQFDVIHFQDWQANGFHAIQSKRVGLHFGDTRLVVTMHSSTEWQHEGMRRWLEWPVEEAKLQYCERYCCEYADTVVSPSHHMIDWCRSRGWNLATDTRVIPYCWVPGETKQPIAEPSRSVIAFFGRLETRKGLEVFLDALCEIDRAGDLGPLETVQFFGKVGMTSSGRADEHIRTALANTSLRYSVHSNLDSFQARKMLLETKAIAICPSLLDNYPLTILECTMDGIPVLAARTGGIPEILGPGATFEPTAKEMADAIRSALRGDVAFASAYDPDAAAAAWRNLGARISESALSRRPLVSIVIPHYNYCDHIVGTVQRCLRQSYSNTEIIVIDDGSTDPRADGVLHALATLDPRVRVFRQHNAGPSAARNHGARVSNGEYLAFVDADNEPWPEMVQSMVTAIEQSGADFVTCHMLAFDGRNDKGAVHIPEYRYTPVGPAIEVGAHENVFGDTNFIGRADVFLAEGGFPDTPFSRAGGVEDWEFLARAAIRGRRLEVIPEPLFWYRSGGDRTASAKPYLGRREILRHYAELLAPKVPWLFHSMLYPLAYRYAEKHLYALGLEKAQPNNSTLPFFSRHILRWTLKLDSAAAKIAPANSRLRFLLKRLLRSPGSKETGGHGRFG